MLSISDRIEGGKNISYDFAIRNQNILEPDLSKIYRALSRNFFHIMNYSNTPHVPLNRRFSKSRKIALGITYRFATFTFAVALRFENQKNLCGYVAENNFELLMFATDIVVRYIIWCDKIWRALYGRSIIRGILI